MSDLFIFAAAMLALCFSATPALDWNHKHQGRYILISLALVGVIVLAAVTA